MWQPVEEHCRALGERFKFVNAPTTSTATRPARCGSRWRIPPPTPRSSASSMPITWCIRTGCNDLVPAFADPQVGIVQAPQDHRDGERSPLHHAMNGEYAGFFDIGMVQRNEANAIIVHGTMCLIRRAALDAAGGWSSDTICEDTDLGLTMLEQGWLAPLHQPPLRPRPAARHLRGLQEAARPLGLRRLPDPQEALAALAAARATPDAGPEARVRVRLAQLARRRERRRRWSRSSIWSGCRSSPSPASPFPTRS